MIEFDCPHCQNPLKVADNLAGRDGWCRVCKRWIVIPMGNRKGSPMDSMTVEEKYERLEHMLQYAATKADNLKGLLSKYCDENGNMIPADTAQFRRMKRDKYENRLARMERELREMEGVIRNTKRERDEAIVERNRFRDDLQGVEARNENRFCESETPGAVSADSDMRLEKLQEELDAVGAARDAAQVDREKLTDRIVRLEEELGATRDEARGLSEEIEVVQRAANAAKNELQEIEALQQKIESLTASDSELRRDGEQRVKELAEAREESDRLREALDAAEKSARNGSSKNGLDLSSFAVQSAPVSVEGELVSQLGDPLMDSYLRFLHSKSGKDGISSDE